VVHGRTEHIGLAQELDASLMRVHLKAIWVSVVPWRQLAPNLKVEDKSFDSKLLRNLIFENEVSLFKLAAEHGKSGKGLQ